MGNACGLWNIDNLRYRHRLLYTLRSHERLEHKKMNYLAIRKVSGYIEILVEGYYYCMYYVVVIHTSIDTLLYEYYSTNFYAREKPGSYAP